MAVLIEGISIIIKRKSIEEKYTGGWDSFINCIPNKTFCADDELVRIGFMVPDDVKKYINSLEENNLEYLKNGLAVDLNVVDQLHDSTMKCNWIEIGFINFDNDLNKKIKCCRLKHSKLNQLLTPDGWQYEGSLSNQFGFIPNGEVHKSLKFLRNENGCDVYFNILSGKEVYVGRSVNDKST